MTDSKPFFLEGRKCPTRQFVASIAWRLRAMELEADAAFIEALDRNDPRIHSLFGISNAEREQERGAGFTPGPCQSEHLARLQEVDHDPSEALDGLIAAGIEDMARAHAVQLRAKPKRSADSPRRSERGTSEASAQGAKASSSSHPKATRVRPLTFPRKSAA